MSQITGELTRLLEDFVSREPIPGLAVGVIADKKVIFTKGFGVKNTETKDPVTAHSLFHMASVSKTFVALGMMQLVQDGKLGLEDYVKDHLPYFTMKDPRYLKITIRQLLSHVSGMPDEESFDWANPEYDDEALERYVKGLYNKELLWDPGSGSAYSNIAYEILGDVIQKVSATPFETYMKRKILEKLNMKKSSFLKAEFNTELLTTPHVLNTDGYYGPRVSKIYPYHRAHGPSSTLCSNVVDMCSYAQAVLNNDSGLLKHDSFARLFEPHSGTPWGKETSENGLAWFLGEYKGRRVASHGGLDTGYRSNLVLLPDDGIAVVLMTNADYIGTKVIWNTILDVIFGEPVQRIKNSLARHLAGLFVESGQKEAFEEYRKIKENKFDGFLLIEGELNFAAYELFEAGKVDEALGLLLLAIDLYPESSNLHDSVGEMYEAKGSNNAAAGYFSKAIALDPDNKDAIANLERVKKQ
ncbi:serine hydrolase [Bacillus sp. H-16]|uniref:serine hydrolase domain-containing protein n=1 Tax=Alteribacter salitolerans TaxID=2912333 RepID=UPI0019654A22|nr:serine hydrolase domain-containing protein [Alteribacter salitolerans]MBM7095082.1 serine hydrolase [Alteribacter salitolerans]